MNTKTILAALALLSSASAFAQDGAVPNGVFTKLRVETTDGYTGAYKNVQLSGTIQAGVNQCQGDNYYEVAVEKTVGEDGVTFKGIGRKREMQNRILCSNQVDANYQGLSFVANFDVEANLATWAKVEDVAVAGTVRSIHEFTVMAVDCAEFLAQDLRICTHEYQPQECTYGDIKYSGANKCVALNNLKHTLCQAAPSSLIEIDRSLSSCVNPLHIELK